MDYQIACVYDEFFSMALSRLESKVQKLCQEGYEPYGYLHIEQNAKSTRWYVCQPMVKAEKNQDK